MEIKTDKVNSILGSILFLIAFGFFYVTLILSSILLPILLLFFRHYDIKFSLGKSEDLFISFKKYKKEESDSEVLDDVQFDK